MKRKLEFKSILLDWFATNDRPLPWKGEKNPYYIWLSEIILQQTRVEQGMPYFIRFKTNYPTVKDLADASEDEVMKLWEGLGYYSRARNLHTTAKYIAYDLNGVFPKTHQEILKLKGVGEYTAAAIASFAYNLPYAVVDGNVYRVLSRIFGIETPIDSTAGKKEFRQLADELLDKDQAGIYNQAIMDFGATHCTPKLPKCESCPFQTHCKAYHENTISLLPIKAKKLKKRTRYFNYLILENGNSIWLHKRIEKDIWQNLYDFPLIESTALLDEEKLLEHNEWKSIFEDVSPTFVRKSKVFQQQLSHQKIIAVFWKFQFEGTITHKKDSYFLTNHENLAKFAFPKIIDWYLQDNSLILF